MACIRVSFVISMCIASLVIALVITGHGADAARTFLVFGDSLVDVGNNNYLLTEARADSPPYGIDTPSHRPTGRFSNGLNIADIISEKLGSEPPLPILSPQLTGDKLLVGANFASAGVGVLNDTGFQFLHTIKIYKQLELFQQYQQRLCEHIGHEAAQQRVNQALSLISLGGNDFVNNYFFPLSIRRRQLDLPTFVNLVISEYRKVLVRMYDLGVRRVMVLGAGPLGCVPSMLALANTTEGQCVPEPTRASDMYNPSLVEMIKGLNSELGSDVFIIANAGLMQNDFIHYPEAFGFVTSRVACCGAGPYNGLGSCTLVSNLCTNRDIYAFWDAFHPTERANRLIVSQMMTASTKYMHPMNLSTILALDSRV